MSSNVVNLGAHHGAQIADGLEQLASSVRSGEVIMDRCIIIASNGNADATDVAFAFFGRTQSLPETLGTLEIAKFQLITEHE